MTDAVITWVDGDDARHREERQHYLASEPPNGLTKRYSHPTRFRSRFELWYCIRSIRKYARWIGTIYLVTDRQRPKWLSDQTAQALNVVLVDHAEIFAGFESALPTFSSRTIETFLHRIPGISDEFVYFNDDFFLVAITQKEDYFKNALPLWRGAWTSRNKVMRKMRFCAQWFARQYKNERCREGLMDSPSSIGMLSPGKVFMLAHAPFPINRKDMENVVEENGLIEKNILYRFRNPRQIRPIALMINKGLRSGRGYEGPRDWYYLTCNRHKGSVLRRRLRWCSHRQGIRSLCIQSLDMADIKDQEAIEKMLALICDD